MALRLSWKVAGLFTVPLVQNMTYYYILLLIAVILLAFQFTLNKVYQKKRGSSMISSLLFTTLTGFAAAVIFICANGFCIDFTLYSLFMASLTATLCTTYTLIGFKILSIGPMAVYMMFLMLGGMLLPYLYGVFFLNEPPTVFRIIGVILLAVSMIFPVAAGKRKNIGAAKGTSALFIILCFAVFIINGFVSIVSKMHQISEIGVPAASFVILSNLATAVISSVILAIICIVKKVPPTYTEHEAILYASTPGENAKAKSTGKMLITIAMLVVLQAACGGTSYALQLIGASKVDASVLYPIITGGSVVLSAVSAFVFFREKPDRITLFGLILSFAATFLFLL